MSDTDQLRDVLQQNREALTAAPSASRGNTQSAERRLGCKFAPGDRVFDTVVGEEGTVERSVGAQGAAVEIVDVRLSGGRLVARRVDQLVARPTPPKVAP